MVRSLTLGLMIALLISLAGCFSSHPGDIEAFLRPHEAVVTAKTYILQPPDEIEIHCSKVPEIDLQRQRIRPDGNVTFENLGSIEAAGKTPEQVADILRAKVLELYALAGDKPIDVRILTYRSKVYYVFGEVYFPGRKPYTGRDTVLTAIAEARPTVMAWDKRIQVIRPSNDKNVRARIFEVNFLRMRKHGDTSKNVLLQEGDIVYVPPTVLAWVGKKIEELVTPIGRAFATVNIVQRTQTGGGGGYGGY